MISAMACSRRFRGGPNKDRAARDIHARPRERRPLARRFGFGPVSASFATSSPLRQKARKRNQIMTLDLNGNWTDADLAKLLASQIDDRDWRLEVDAAGIASLADKTANPTGPDYDEGLHCFFETWMTGTDFVGSGAASDKALVGKIAKALRGNYPALSGPKFVYVAL
jgi:hypothetical protein